MPKEFYDQHCRRIPDLIRHLGLLPQWKYQNLRDTVALLGLKPGSRTENWAALNALIASVNPPRYDNHRDRARQKRILFYLDHPEYELPPHVSRYISRLVLH